MTQSKRTKLIKWDGKTLYYKDQQTGEVLELGSINTSKMGLTQEQKLRAVQHQNKWIWVSKAGTVVTKPKQKTD